MKNIRTMLAVCLMVMASAVYAQADAWKGVRVSYNSFTIEDSDACMGISAGYVHSFAITESLPLFVEAGADVLWLNDSDFTMWALEIPVSIGYKWAINDDWSLYPNVGVNLRGNILGEAGDANIFDEDEMGGNEFKRFNFGLHVGSTVNYKNFNLGAKYGMDLNEIAKGGKAKMWTVTLGYNF